MVEETTIAAEADPYADLKRHRAATERVAERQAVVPRKVQKRRTHFVRFPMTWFERMKGAPGQSYRVALYLLYLNWKGKGAPIKLANGMLQEDGVGRHSKWRALGDLEARELIAVERRRSRSPIIRLNPTYL
jgi:hypothetical protein